MTLLWRINERWFLKPQPRYLPWTAFLCLSDNISPSLSQKHLQQMKSEIKVMTLYVLFFCCSLSVHYFYLPFSAHCITMYFYIQIPNISDCWILLFLNKLYVIPLAAKFGLFSLYFIICIRSFFSFCIYVSPVQTSFKSYLEYYTILLTGLLLYSAAHFVHLTTPLVTPTLPRR